MKFAFKVYLRQNKKGATLRVVVTYNNKSVERSLSTPTIDTDLWDSKRQRMKHGSESTVIVNTAINNAEDRVVALFSKCQQNGRIPLRQEVSDTIVGIRSFVPDSFIDVFDKYCRDASTIRGWSHHYQVTLSTLRYHIVRSHLFDMAAEDVRRETIDTFTTMMISEGMANSSINTHITILRASLRWMKNNGINIDSSVFVHQTLKTPKREPLFLSADEVQQIEDLALSRASFDSIVRDIFLLQCYTGLRWSDASSLRWDSISDGLIHVVATKTTSEVSINIGVHAAAIIERYRQFQDVSERVFPRISIAGFNIAIKRIGKAAGINTPITKVQMVGAQRVNTTIPKYEALSSHVGRKTFVSLALSAGVPHAVIVKWTGHASINAFMRYANVMAEAKAEGMEKFEEILCHSSAIDLLPKDETE